MKLLWKWQVCDKHDINKEVFMVELFATIIV